MKRIKILLLILFAINGPIYSSAEEYDTTDLLVAEGFVIANATLASQGPDDYGRAMIGLGLLSPAFGSADQSSVTTFTVFVGMEAIGFFNKNMEDNQVSKEKVFYNNIMAWHSLAALGYISEALFGEDSGYALVPIKNGGMLYYSYNF